MSSCTKYASRARQTHPARMRFDSDNRLARLPLAMQKHLANRERPPPAATGCRFAAGGDCLARWRRRSADSRARRWDDGRPGCYMRIRYRFDERSRRVSLTFAHRHGKRLSAEPKKERPREARCSQSDDRAESCTCWNHPGQKSPNASKRSAHSDVRHSGARHSGDQGKPGPPLACPGNDLSERQRNICWNVGGCWHRSSEVDFHRYAPGLRRRDRWSRVGYSHGHNDRRSRFSRSLSPPPSPHRITGDVTSARANIPQPHEPKTRSLHDARPVHLNGRAPVAAGALDNQLTSE